MRLLGQSWHPPCCVCAPRRRAACLPACLPPDPPCAPRPPAACCPTGRARGAAASASRTRFRSWRRGPRRRRWGPEGGPRASGCGPCRAADGGRVAVAGCWAALPGCAPEAPPGAAAHAPLFTRHRTRRLRSAPRRPAWQLTTPRRTRKSLPCAASCTRSSACSLWRCRPACCPAAARAASPRRSNADSLGAAAPGCPARCCGRRPAQLAPPP